MSGWRCTLLGILLADPSVTATALVSSVSTLIPSFDVFAHEHRRSYRLGDEEHRHREALYYLRAAEADDHNQQATRLWTAGVSGLWDRTETELVRFYGQQSAQQRPSPAALLNSTTRTQRQGKPSPAALNGTRLALRSSLELGAHPSNKSWTHLSAWSDGIVDQGDCGSCWAIAAASLLQAHAEIHGHKKTFSVQELVSCVPNPDECGGTGGCGGATMGLALEWALHNSCAAAHEVPYESGWMGETGICRRNDVALAAKPCAFLRLHTGGTRLKRMGCSKAAAKQDLAAAKAGPPHGASFGMTGWMKLPENKYEPLISALVEHGPVGVSVSADEWMMYRSGIFDICSPHALIGHAVVLVEYGVDAGVGYFRLQNSWGRDWGEAGTIRLLREGAAGDEAFCGNDYTPSMGTGCKGGPDQVRVCGMCGILYSPVVPMFSAAT